MAAQHNSDIIGRLTEKKRKEHEDALKNFNSELTRISEVGDAPVHQHTTRFIWYTHLHLIIEHT